MISIPLVCKLHKALNGLREVPWVWFDKLKDSLLHLGFVSSKAYQSLFLRFTSTSCIYLLVYMDDIIITRNDSLAISTLISLLNKKLSLKDLGILHHFFGNWHSSSLFWELRFNIPKIEES